MHMHKIEALKLSCPNDMIMNFQLLDSPYMWPLGFYQVVHVQGLGREGYLLILKVGHILINLAVPLTATLVSRGYSSPVPP